MGEGGGCLFTNVSGWWRRWVDQISSVKVEPRSRSTPGPIDRNGLEGAGGGGVKRIKIYLDIIIPQDHQTSASTDGFHPHPLMYLHIDWLICTRIASHGDETSDQSPDESEISLATHPREVVDFLASPKSVSPLLFRHTFSEPRQRLKDCLEQWQGRAFGIMPDSATSVETVSKKA